MVATEVSYELFQGVYRLKQKESFVNKNNKVA